MKEPWIEGSLVIAFLHSSSDAKNADTTLPSSKWMSSLPSSMCLLDAAHWALCFPVSAGCQLLEGG